MKLTEMIKLWSKQGSELGILLGTFRNRQRKQDNKAKLNTIYGFFLQSSKPKKIKNI